MTTFHALMRAEERAGLRKKYAKRLIANAISHGREADNFAGKERNYLLRKGKADGGRVLVHGEYCFIVRDGDRCVTMYPVPDWFEKRRNGGKRPIISGNNFTRLWTSFHYYDDAA
jgi:hypothetical protein